MNRLAEAVVPAVVHADQEVIGGQCRWCPLRCLACLFRLVLVAQPAENLGPSRQPAGRPQSRLEAVGAGESIKRLAQPPAPVSCRLTRQRAGQRLCIDQQRLVTEGRDEGGLLAREEAGIDGGRVLSGTQLKEMSDAELRENLTSDSREMA